MDRLAMVIQLYSKIKIYNTALDQPNMTILQHNTSFSITNLWMRLDPDRVSQSHPKSPRVSKIHPRITQIQPEPSRASQTHPVANKNLYFTLLFLLQHSYLFLYEAATTTYFQVRISDGHEMKLITSWKKILKTQYTENKYNNIAQFIINFCTPLIITEMVLEN